MESRSVWTKRWNKTKQPKKTKQHSELNRRVLNVTPAALTCHPVPEYRNTVYRFRFSHIDRRADGYRLALRSPVHFFHHAVHVASGEAVKKHRCRRGENVIAVLFGSAGQDVHQRQKEKEKRKRRKGATTQVGILLTLFFFFFSRFPSLRRLSEKSRSRRGGKKYEGKSWTRVLHTTSPLPMETVIWISGAPCFFFLYKLLLIHKRRDC